MELYSPHWMRLVLPSFSFLTHFFFRLMVERVAWFSQPTVSCSSPSLASLLLSTPRMSSTPFGEDVEYQWQITKHPKSTILKPVNSGPRKAWNWKWRALSKWQPRSWITINQAVLYRELGLDQKWWQHIGTLPTRCKSESSHKNFSEQWQIQTPFKIVINPLTVV